MRGKHLASLIVVLVLVIATGVMAIYPQDPLSLRLECSPGADLTANPATYTWTDITRDLSMSIPVTHTRGSQDEQSESNSDSSFGLRNNTGRYTTGNPMSDLYPGFGLGTPFRFSTNTGDGSGWHVEWIHYLAEAADDWPSGTPHLCRAMVACGGLFRRLGQGETKKPAMERSILAASPVEYWKLEDVPGTVAAANQAGPAQLRNLFGLPEWQTLDTGPGGGGAGIAPQLNDYIGQVVLNQPMPWAVEFSYLRPSDGSADGKTVFDIRLVSSIISAQAITVDAGSVQPASNWHQWVIAGNQIDGSNYKLNMWHNGVAVASSTFAGTIGALTALTLLPDAVGFGSTAPVSIGHIAVFANDGTTLVDHYNALQGYPGELAHTRANRLCTEKGIPFATSATTSARMGVQPIATDLGVLRDLEETDHGQLDDSQGVVNYRALSEFYNQTVPLTVNAAVPNRLFLPFNPVTDDQKRRNKVTASMPDGTSSTVTNTTDITKAGEFEGTISSNVQSADQLPFHAAWIANNVGVVPGKRYPGIILDFLRAPDLLADFRNMRLSDRITITNPPRQHTRADIDLILPGWSTIIEGRGRVYQLAANCSPYSPYAVGTSGGGGTAGSWSQTGPTTQLAAQLNTGSTALSVTISGPLFTTVADLTATPLSVVLSARIGDPGEVCPVVSISGTSPQTINVTRVLPKTWPTGTIVQVYRPLTAAL